MQMNEENNAGGAGGMPDIAGVDGFVGSDDEEGEPDARAQELWNVSTSFTRVVKRLHGESCVHGPHLRKASAKRNERRCVHV